MKKKIIILLTLVLTAACQPKGPERYATSGPEIDRVKSLIEDYQKGDWEAWKGHYADTAKIHHNSPKSVSLSPKELNENLKAILATTSSYKFDEKPIYYEKIIDDEGKTWVNFWGDWRGTIAATNKELVIPVHLSLHMADGKIQEEYGMYNLAEYMTQMEAIEAKNAMQPDQKIIDQNFDDFIYTFHNKQDISVLDGLLAPNYVRYMNGVKAATGAKELGEGMRKTFMKAFPNMKITASERVYDGNKLFFYWSFKGTNTGEFNGVPATGKKVEISGLSEGRFNSDGKMYLEKVFFNELDLMNQLGYTLSPPK